MQSTTEPEKKSTEKLEVKVREKKDVIHGKQISEIIIIRAFTLVGLLDMV